MQTYTQLYSFRKSPTAGISPTIAHIGPEICKEFNFLFTWTEYIGSAKEPLSLKFEWKLIARNILSAYQRRLSHKDILAPNISQLVTFSNTWAKQTFLTMPHDLAPRATNSLALFWVSTRIDYLGSPVNQGITHLPDLVWGTWGLGVVLGLGRGRRGLCGVVAEERKALCYSRS